MRRSTTAALIPVLLFAGCTTITPREAGQRDKLLAAQCKDYCHELGMKFAAYVIVGLNKGCVCEPSGEAGAASRGPAAASAVAAVVAEEELSEHIRRSSGSPSGSGHH